MPKVKITKSLVDQVPHPERGQVAYCDSELRGFYLIVGNQTKTYVVQKDMRGRTVRCTIGRHGHLTPDQARKIAKERLFLMSTGINPNKVEAEERAKAITLKEVLESYKKTRKTLKERTKEDYDYYTNKYFGDWLGRLMIDITKEMAVTRHTYIGEHHGPITANSAMRILRALFNHAHVHYEICEVNPVAYLSKIKAWYPQKRRRTYIKPHQLKDWWKAVQELKNDTYKDFFILLLFTGLRRSEAMTLRWANIDFEDKTFTVPQTKNGDSLTLPLSEFLCGMLKARQKRYGNYEFVFPGPGKFGHIIEPKKGVQKVIATSGVAFTCHDLRRSFITYAEGLELAHYALKRLLNHRVTDITGSYIIVDAERLREPVEKIAKFILEQAHGRSLRGDS